MESPPKMFATPMFKTAMAVAATTMFAAPIAFTAVVATPMPAFAKKGADDVKGDYKKVAKGTELTIKLEDGLSSGKNVDGDTFSATIATGFFGDKTFKGFTVNGHVEGIKKAGMMGKKGELDIVFDELVSPKGKVYPIEATLTSVPKPEGKFLRNAAIVMSGAVAGHHIGKKTNKKHGALLGAASATAVALTMPGGDVVIKSGSKLKMKLDKSVSVQQ